MSPNVIKQVVRLRFALTRGATASRRIAAVGDKYLAMAAELDPARGRQPVHVPPMLGVDDDMRDWSFYMLIEHNTIVNRSITAVMHHLATGEAIPPHLVIDPKRDVMPSPDPGPEQMAAFRESVDNHLRVAAAAGRLRGTARRPHPLFGDFDAHHWHCMFGFHLAIHVKQARRILA